MFGEVFWQNRIVVRIIGNRFHSECWERFPDGNWSIMRLKILITFIWVTFVRVWYACVCVCERERKSEVWARETENARLRIHKWTDVSDNKIAAILNYGNVALQGSEENVVFRELSRSGNGLFVYVISVITILVLSFFLCVVVSKTWIFREVRRNSFDIWKIFWNSIERRKNFAQISKFMFKGRYVNGFYESWRRIFLCLGNLFLLNFLSGMMNQKKKFLVVYSRKS